MFDPCLLVNVPMYSGVPSPTEQAVNVIHGSCCVVWYDGMLLLYSVGLA